MRKIVIAVMSTVSAVVLVVSFDASRRDATLVTAAAPGGSETDDATIPTADPTDPAVTAGDVPRGGESESEAEAESESESVAESESESASVSEPAARTTQGGNVSGTFTGAAAPTRWGPVQVRIVVKNGRIVRATAIEYPQENHHDIEINAWAIPQLEQATVDSNGQEVDSYSGATVTCDGYRASLQSALDKAHL